MIGDHIGILMLDFLFQCCVLKLPIPGILKLLLGIHDPISNYKIHCWEI